MSDKAALAEGTTNQKGAPNNRSLSRVVFLSLFASLIFATLIIVGILSFVFYGVSEQQTETALRVHTEEVASDLKSLNNDEAVAVLKDQIPGIERITLIQSDGVVLFDSKLEASELESHANRPEVIGAQQNGKVVVARRSQTLADDFLYAAVSLPNGSILRISQIRQSFTYFVHESAFPILATIAVALLITFFISRLVTRHIMKPIDKMDPSGRLADVAYIEMQPLFKRIDEQKAELRKKNVELQEAADIRRNFSSNVTHEMKTPLQVISGYAELINAGIADGEDAQKFAGLIGEEAVMMRKLIDDILTLSRLDESAIAQDKLPVDLCALISRCALRLTPVAEGKNVSLRLEGIEQDCEQSACIVYGHESLLEEAIYNLIDNAIRYTPEQGSVVVKLSQENTGTSQGVRVSVTDTGFGIPKEQQEKIFERFYRIDESRSKETGGTGLGLAIVKHVVEEHGGKITVASEPGAGSTFTILL